MPTFITSFSFSSSANTFQLTNIRAYYVSTNLVHQIYMIMIIMVPPLTTKTFYLK